MKFTGGHDHRTDLTCVYRQWAELLGSELSIIAAFTVNAVRLSPPPCEQRVHFLHQSSTSSTRPVGFVFGTGSRVFLGLQKHDVNYFPLFNVSM